MFNSVVHSGVIFVYDLNYGTYIMFFERVVHPMVSTLLLNKLSFPHWYKPLI